MADKAKSFNHTGYGCVSSCGFSKPPSPKLAFKVGMDSQLSVFFCNETKTEHSLFIKNFCKIDKFELQAL